MHLGDMYFDQIEKHYVNTRVVSYIVEIQKQCGIWIVQFTIYEMQLYWLVK